MHMHTQENILCSRNSPETRKIVGERIAREDLLGLDERAEAAEKLEVLCHVCREDHLNHHRAHGGPVLLSQRTKHVAVIALQDPERGCGVMVLEHRLLLLCE